MARSSLASGVQQYMAVPLSREPDREWSSSSERTKMHKDSHPHNTGLVLQDIINSQSTMSIIYNKIQQSAHQNEQLLRGLEETDDAHSRLMQQTRYVDDLEVQMSTAAKHAERLKDKALLELKDHEKYRDSTFRRFAHKASGNQDKFTEKATKEEQEYLDAIKHQKDAEDELAYLKQLVGEAEGRRKEIAAEVQHHKSLQAELDALYDSIFAGPNSEFPEEDVKEEARDAAYAYVESVTQRIKHQQHIVSLLDQTTKKLSSARAALDRAYSSSQRDVIGGGSFSSMRKLDHLEMAESMMRQVRQLQDQLKQATSEVPGLGQVVVPKGSFTKDILFDNIFTDMRMHEEIKQSIAQVNRATNQCDAIRRQQREVEKNIRQELSQAQTRLKDAALELQRVREEAFRSVLSGGTHHHQSTTTAGEAAIPTVGSEAPPEYTPREGPPPGYAG